MSGAQVWALVEEPPRFRVRCSPEREEGARCRARRATAGAALPGCGPFLTFVLGPLSRGHGGPDAAVRGGCSASERSCVCWGLRGAVPPAAGRRRAASHVAKRAARAEGRSSEGASPSLWTPEHISSALIHRLAPEVKVQTKNTKGKEHRPESIHSLNRVVLSVLSARHRSESQECNREQNRRKVLPS